MATTTSKTVAIPGKLNLKRKAVIADDPPVGNPTTSPVVVVTAPNCPYPPIRHTLFGGKVAPCNGAQTILRQKATNADKNAGEWYHNCSVCTEEKTGNDGTVYINKVWAGWASPEKQAEQEEQNKKKAAETKKMKTEADKLVATQVDEIHQMVVMLREQLEEFKTEVLSKLDAGGGASE